jgi:hypothetical protein
MGDWTETKALQGGHQAAPGSLPGPEQFGFPEHLYYRWKAPTGVVDYYEGVVRAYEGRTWSAAAPLQSCGGGAVRRHPSRPCLPSVHAVQGDDFGPFEKWPLFRRRRPVPDLTAVYAPTRRELAVNAWDPPNPFAHRLAAEAMSVPESVLRRDLGYERSRSRQAVTPDPDSRLSARLQAPALRGEAAQQRVYDLDAHDDRLASGSGAVSVYQARVGHQVDADGRQRVPGPALALRRRGGRERGHGEALGHQRDREGDGVDLPRCHSLQNRHSSTDVFGLSTQLCDARAHTPSGLPPPQTLGPV